MKYYIITWTGAPETTAWSQTKMATPRGGKHMKTEGQALAVLDRYLDRCKDLAALVRLYHKPVVQAVGEDPLKFPSELKFYTLDEVAETLPVSAELYRKLWSLMPAKVPPEGEWPEPDSKHRRACGLKKHWAKLSTEEQAEIVAAYKKENGT